jgi:hypothetical protein
VIGIPRYIIPEFIRLLVKWEKCSGIGWTIDRLKGLKVDLIRRHAGQHSLTWIRKNRKGDIAGTLGSLFRWADKSENNFGRSVQALMAYTYYIHGSLTDAQKEKFLSAVNPTLKETFTTRFLTGFCLTTSQTLRKRSVHVTARPLVTYRGCSSKRAPRHFGRSSVPQDHRILDDLQVFNTPGGLYLFNKYRRLYKPLLLGLGYRQEHLLRLTEQTNPKPEKVYGGEVHFLQEPGGKLRSIASPFRIHQEVLRPLGLLLYDAVKSLPWDCTFDQTKALPHIQAHLSHGGQIHSVDLSSATDYFPLSLQLAVLRTIIDKKDWDHIDLFEEISRGTWKSSIGEIAWTKGQPLGLFPSFASFALTHGILLKHCCPGGRYSGQFYVLGDDVVILDEKVYERYQIMLARMVCPWSTDKSLSSSKLAEFAGKIITSTRIIPQMKWRGISDDSFLDICRLLGRQSRSLLSNRQKKVFDQVAHLCEPIGLNHSLPGDNLQKMVMRTLDFYQPEKTVLGSMMGLRKKLHRLVYSSDESFNQEQLSEISATFDEKVKSALARTIFARWSSSNSICLEAFESMPEALGLSPRLPLKEVTSNRVTTLEWYERHLLR